MPTHLDLSVSARHHTARVLVRLRRLLHVRCAAQILFLHEFGAIVIGLRHDFPSPPSAILPLRKAEDIRNADVEI